MRKINGEGLQLGQGGGGGVGFGANGWLFRLLLALACRKASRWSAGSSAAGITSNQGIEHLIDKPLCFDARKDVHSY